MKNIKLYYSETCPYCKDIVSYIENENLDIELMNVSKDIELNKEVERIGGKVQVPMLTIDGKPMYESSDIMEWIKKNL